MTTEELYEEFKSVTNFDESKMKPDKIKYIKDMMLKEDIIGSNFEGIVMDFGDRYPQLTYFHNGK